MEKMIRSEADKAKIDHILIEIMGWTHVRNEIYHSPYCGDVDFGSTSPDAIARVAQMSIAEAGRVDGARNIQFQMREVLGL